MTGTRVRLLSFLLVAALALIACGKDSKSESDEAEEAKAGEPCPAKPAALAGDTGLPGQFPTVTGLTYTATRAAGPSTIVTGFVEADLADAYSRWKAALDKAPYSVTRSEKDPHDAEVNFSGQQTTGQVRLGELCRGRTSVHVTARPG